LPGLDLAGKSSDVGNSSTWSVACLGGEWRELTQKLRRVKFLKYQCKSDYKGHQDLSDELYIDYGRNKEVAAQDFVLVSRRVLVCYRDT
jgi:hypothetical protein